MKKQTIIENHTYVTDKSFTFTLGDDKPRQFGIYFEITNMLEATGESEFKNYPFIVSAQLVADVVHKSFDEDHNGDPTKLGLIYDCVSYMGGVPIDHTLQDAVNGRLEELSKQFSVGEACLITNKHDFGTIAAQEGKGAEHSYLQFKTEDAANKFINLLIKRAPVLSTMIGFILDKPINMMGDTGWSVIEKQVEGCK